MWKGLIGKAGTDGDAIKDSLLSLTHTHTHRQGKASILNVVNKMNLKSECEVEYESEFKWELECYLEKE